MFVGISSLLATTSFGSLNTIVGSNIACATSIMIGSLPFMDRVCLCFLV